MEVRALSSVPSDSELVELHRYGDPEAFEAIYDRFGGMVFGLALRMSGDAEEAADCTQEVFLRVHRYLDSFRGRSSLKTWIFRIAINCCRTRLRRRARRGRVFEATEPEVLNEFEDGRRGPEDLAAAHELSRRVGELLAELKPHYREAVILRDVQGWSYQEIAGVLRIRLGTVRSRIARGRQHLRSLLESEK